MKRLFPLVLVPLLTACEGWEDFELDPYLPKVSFQRIDVLAVDWDGVDADFLFDVDNPNPIDVSMARFDYALAFEQVEWLSGDSPDGLVLSAEDSSELALPVSIEFESLFDMVQAVRGQDEIGFGLDGSFGFDTPVGPLDVPYDEDGGFPAPRRPGFTMNKLKLKNLNISGAELALKLDVDNEHGSNLFFENVDYQIALAGVDIGGGFIDELGSVDGATTETVSIPIEIDFLDAGVALYSVLQGEKLEVDFQADMDVDTPFGVVPLQVDQLAEIGIER
ncbi:MAG TPA: LEA type 2 family protein [Myxococcota bacterium]|nr:LEA type 2 family protein [Myxococcota bacterium]